MMEWQPIETAPKDGAKFLGGTKYDQFTCRWGSHFLRTIGGEELMGWVRADGQAGNTANPTHWMPLREPPKSSEAPQSEAEQP